MDTDRDLYQILQVDPAAEQEVVQAAFKRLAFKYHPDKNPSEDAHRRMQELNEAYAVIGDPAKRAAYDTQRQITQAAQRRVEDEVRQRSEAERRAEAARQRKEQMAAQRRAANERQAAEQANAAQRRAEYEQRIREQMAAQRKAKREKQQREQEAQQAREYTRDQAAAPIEPPSPIEPVKPIEPEPEPITVPQAEAPQLTESERRQLALIQSRQALQNEIFKVDYGLTDAMERLKYWNTRRMPWEVSLQCGQRTPFIIGALVTITALVVALVGRGLEGDIAWLVWGGVSLGAVWWTWRGCISIVPVRSFVDAWSAAKHARELQLQHLKTELAQLEAAMKVDGSIDE